MQENNFEKQVQQKTDELRLSPSEEVWQKVAVAITKRKSGWRGLIVLFLLLIIICSSLFVIFNRGGGTKINNALSKNNDVNKTSVIIADTNDSNTRQVIAGTTYPKTNQNKAVSEPPAKLKNWRLAKQVADQQQSKQIPARTKTHTSAAINKVSSDSTGNVAYNDVQPERAKNKSKHNKTRQRLDILINSGVSMESTKEKKVLNNISKTQSGAPLIAAHDIIVKDPGTHTPDADQTNLTQPLEKEREQETNTTGQPLLAKPSAQRQQKNKWKVGAKISLGISATQNGYFGIINSDNSDAYKSADLGSVTVPNNNGGQGTRTVYSPSKIKAGAGIVFGLFVQKNISARTAFTLGLNYKGYNSSMMTGNRVDSLSSFSSLDFYYRNGSSHKYKNHFNFLELPVDIRFKLGRQNKVPLYLKMGLSISRLLSTNALQFDTLSGTYYRNNAAFDKTLVSVSGGLLFSLTPRAKNPLLIGPDINFSLNKMANSGLFKSRHYNYFGIQVQKTVGRR